MDLSALGQLRIFRQQVHGLCSHRADALFDVMDGALAAGLVSSFGYVSLQAAHQRRHGSLYAALTKGRVNVAGIRKLVASMLPETAHPVYAIDTSTYLRSDAETSSERGIYYHSSRHSAGKPVVEDVKLPWQRPQEPARMTPGRPKGSLSGRAPRFPARHRRTSNAKHLATSS